MLRVGCVVLLIAAVVGCESEVKEVPEPVLKSVQKAYPGAVPKDVEFEHGVYEIELVKDGREIEVKVDPSGSIIKEEVEEEEEADEGKEKEQEIALDAVPQNVKDAALSAVSGLFLAKVELEEKNGKKYYELEGVAEGKKVEVKVTTDGKVLRVEPEEEDKEADDEGEAEEDED